MVCVVWKVDLTTVGEDMDLLVSNPPGGPGTLRETVGIILTNVESVLRYSNFEKELHDRTLENRPKRQRGRISQYIVNGRQETFFWRACGSFKYSNAVVSRLMPLGDAFV